MHRVDDTICALASPRGGALRGIVRLSGPVVRDCLTRIVSLPADAWFQEVTVPTVLTGTIAIPDVNAPLPCSVYFWPSNRSYTRQPAAEIHTLGSPPLLSGVVTVCCDAGARLAEPGEFTMRAFLAGRLDLTQAEAVLGVIDAQGQEELDVALRQLAGGMATPLHQLREDLLTLLAHLEAGLDFVEEDIEFISSEGVIEQLDDASSNIDTLLEQMRRRSGTMDRYRIVLVGQPNAGKSSLLNGLVQQSAAIVSDVAGTTRDYVSCPMTFGAFECDLIDTAGMEEHTPETSVTNAAQQAASQQQQQADIVLFCVDQSRPLTARDNERLQNLPRNTILVMTKSDLTASTSIEAAIRTSATTGQGLDVLRTAVVDRLNLLQGDVRILATTTQRCRDSLTRALASLRSAREAAIASLGDEFVAVELREALDELGRVVGAVYTDDILDRVFRQFCIGK